jgi:hypothetical protein
MNNEISYQVTANQAKALRNFDIPEAKIQALTALKGKTPAEVAGIEVKGKDRSLTVIQNTSKDRSDMSRIEHYK